MKRVEAMELEQPVALRCGDGAVEETILNARAAAGKDVNPLTPKDRVRCQS